MRIVSSRSIRSRTVSLDGCRATTFRRSENCAPGLISWHCAGTADRFLADIKAQSGDDVAVVIGIWDTASHFWCDACHRAGVPYYIVAYGVELLMELYGRLPRWRQRDFARRSV